MPPRSAHSAPAPPAESVHRLPSARLVERLPFVVALARGKRVIDLGFVNEGRTELDRALGRWLHAQLADASSSLVGIDADEKGVEEAAALGFHVRCADCQSRAELEGLGLEPADLVVAGEIIEHLTNPGGLLDAIHVLLRPGGRLVVTTTNATALTSSVAGLLGLELVNSDHVGWYSWWTGRTMLERHGWRLTQLAYYPAPRFEERPGLPPGHRLRIRAFNAYQTLARPLFRLRPSLADGIIFVAEPA
jgi:SAM-dependent methyltransferase